MFWSFNITTHSESLNSWLAFVDIDPSHDISFISTREEPFYFPSTYCFYNMKEWLYEFYKCGESWISITPWERSASIVENIKKKKNKAKQNKILPINAYCESYVLLFLLVNISLVINSGFFSSPCVFRWRLTGLDIAMPWSALNVHRPNPSLIFL